MHTAQTASDFEELPDEQLVIGESIGKGAHCEVMNGWWNGMLVAVKVYNRLSISKRQLQMLRNEVKILKHLDHPNIIKLKGVFQTKRNILLLLQHAGEIDLQAYIRRKLFKLPPHEAVLLAKQLLLAAAHLHSKGYCHRDIKPANLMVQEGRLRLIDFGYACRLDCPQQSIGTTQFMAPELLNKIKDGFQWALVDMWAVGVVLHFMGTGRLPFNGFDEKNVTKKIIKLDWKKVAEGVPQSDCQADPQAVCAGSLGAA